MKRIDAVGVRKDKTINRYGEFRTARRVLTAWDHLMADGKFQDWTR
jgi:hypothetical protein